MIEYLTELRRRLLRIILVIALVVVVFSFFSNSIYSIFSFPLMKFFPNGKGLIATSLPASFLIPFKSACLLAIYVTVPYWLYEIWSFIAPALYKHERYLGWAFLFGGTILFYLGTLFAYFVVMPMMFHFFIVTAPSSVEVRPDISSYFDLVTRLFFAFGCSFELPILILIMVASNWISIESLQRKRPVVIVLAFVVGMLLTPPDVISQTLLAVPLWFLFEMGVVMARFLLPRFRFMILKKDF